MRNLILGLCTLAAFSFIMPVNGVCGERMQKEGPAGLQSPNQAGATKEEKKQALINNFNAMRNQELRVILLQQMLNEEAVKLNNLQEQFCKLYNLDVNKLRQGVYRYDETQDKFVEAQPPQPAPAPQR